jgi:predicted glycoside hydrolase/deacetylase ChbG (UPF0249 family)
MTRGLELLIAQTILQGFDAQYGRFLEVTSGALSFRDAAQLLHHQTHMVVIEVDPLFHRLLHRMPCRLFAAGESPLHPFAAGLPSF